MAIPRQNKSTERRDGYWQEPPDMHHDTWVMMQLYPDMLRCNILRYSTEFTRLQDDPGAPPG